MSRGPGKIQRAIEAVFEAEPDNAFLLSELCERVYTGRNRVEKKHRVAVARAAKKLPGLKWMMREALGGELVFYDPLNVMSYAMARLKADFTNRYRNNDNRWFVPRGWFRDAMGFKKGYAYRWPEKSEAELRALIAEGGPDHKHVVKGGAWFGHTEVAKLRARGKTKAADKMQAKQTAAFEKRFAKDIAKIARPSR
jgi:hypothetical protein